MAVYLTVLKPGDTYLAMDLAHGGHLTHGMHLNFSGQLYNAVHYGVRESDHRIDFDHVVSLAREHKPKLIVAGASAYPREIEHPKFAEIAREVGAVFMVDMAHYAGLVAAGVHNNPVPSFRLRHVHVTQDAARSAQSGFVLTKEEQRQADFDQARSFPACRADRSCTWWPPRPSASARRSETGLQSSTGNRSSTTPEALAETLISRRHPPRLAAARTTT